MQPRTNPDSEENIRRIDSLGRKAGSGGTHGFVVGHITPEAFDGGLIGLVQDNDIIELNVATKKMTLKVSEEEIARRRANWKQPALKATKGILFKYAKCVKDASEGCVTDE